MLVDNVMQCIHGDYYPPQLHSCLLANMTRRLTEIRETTSNAVQIMRELRDPEVKESLRQAKEMVASAKELIELLRDPMIVKDIENISHTANSLKEISINMHDLTNDLSKSEAIQELVGTAKTVRASLSVLTSKESAETIQAVKEMIVSIKDLADEVTAILSPKKAIEVTTAL